MKFGASTWLWTSPFDGSDVSLLQKIARLGFDFVEIPVEDPTRLDVARIGAALKECGLEAIVCAAVVGERDLSSADPAKVEAAFSYFGACIDIANTWGSPFVVGPLYAPVAKPRLATEKERRDEWDRSVDNLRKLATLAQSKGVRIGIEPLNRFETDMVNRVEDAMRMIAAVDHPALGVSLDSFHMNIEEVDFRKAVELAGDRNSDWNGLKEGLKSAGYAGGISIESFSPDSSSLAEAVCIWRRFAPSQDEFARKGLEFLRNWYA